MKYTRNNLKKLEALFEEMEYTIRYEKGNFQSGYCIVENRKIAVVNKFFDTESRMNVLFEILSTITIDEKELSAGSLKIWKDINKMASKMAAETNPGDEN
jgi:hypothetical protein